MSYNRLATDQLDLNGKEDDLIKILSIPYSDADHYLERERLLSIAISNFKDEEKFCFFIWLLDENQEINELRLDQASLYKHADYDKNISDLSGKYVSIELANNNNFDKNFLSQFISIKSSNTIQSFLIDRNIINDSFHEYIFPLYIPKSPEDINSQNEIIGVAQLLLENEREDLRPFFQRMATTLSGRIATSRRHRIWTAQETLHKEIQDKELSPDRNSDTHGLDNINKILSIAARIIGKQTRSAYCEVGYIQNRCSPKKYRGSFKSNDDNDAYSAIHGCIDDHINELEKTHASARSISGANNIAWMRLPVLTSAVNHDSKVNERAIIGYILVFDKSSPGNLYNVFSNADFKLAETIADALSNILPTNELHFAFQTISTKFSEFKNRFPNYSDLAEFDNEIIVNLIQQLMPCSEWAVVINEEGDIVAPEKRNKEVGELISNNSTKLLKITNDIVTLRQENNELTFLVIGLSEVDEFKRILVIKLHNKKIPEYRHNIAVHLCREASIFMTITMLRDRSLSELVEIRHAIRSGLMGLIGHLSAAKKRYANFYKNDRDSAYTKIISAPAMRRSLERASFFGERTKVLLENPRFFLKDFSASRLKITSFNICNLLEELISCIRPEAEDKDCNLHLNIQQSQESLLQGWADRELYYILLFNIIENAVKYSFRNQNISITLQANYTNWKVSVKNEGVPIPYNLKTRIFSPFQRGQPLRHPDTRRPGTGLGLAVALKILKTHDANREILVDSFIKSHDKERAITTFTIPLPRLSNAKLDTPNE